MSCRFNFVLLLLLLASLSTHVCGLEPEPGSVFIRVADIGAGLCCVIQSSSEEYAVYDTGHWAGSGWRSFNAVDQIVPDDSPVAFMVLSHSDSDHLAATDEILAKYHVVEVIRSGMIRDTNTWKAADIAIREAVETRGTLDLNLAEFEFPQGTFAFGDASITFLGGGHEPPPDWDVHAGGEFLNAGSISIRVEFAGKSVLFCGDAVGRHVGDAADVCIATEKFLCDHADEFEIQSDVLIAPHHGTDNGSSTRFIQTVDPEWVIFSAGHDHEHPTAAAAQRYLDHGVHPGQLRLIFRSRKKNDRADAEKLAKLLFLDEIPTAYMPAKSVRSWRKLIETRRRTVEKRTRVKNSLRALLRGRGLQIPRGFGLWSKSGLKWLTQLDLDATDALQRDLWLDELELLTKQIARMEQELDRIASASPAVALLQTIPGVGPRTAEAIAANIDNPHRFRNAKAVGAYFGLVPSQDQSGTTNRLGHITKEGPATVRKLITEATWHAIRLSPTIKATFERIHRGDRERRKIALVATSHALVRAMYAMLRDNKPWRETVIPETAAA